MVVILYVCTCHSSCLVCSLFTANVLFVAAKSWPILCVLCTFPGLKRLHVMQKWRASGTLSRDSQGGSRLHKVGALWLAWMRLLCRHDSLSCALPATKQARMLTAALPTASPAYTFHASHVHTTQQPHHLLHADCSVCNVCEFMHAPRMLLL